MSSLPPSSTNPASVSRSKTSRDDIKSLADSMLRSSLSGSASSISTSSNAPPAYRRHVSVEERRTVSAPALPAGGLAALAQDSLTLNCEKPFVTGRPPIVGPSRSMASSLAPASITRQQRRRTRSENCELPHTAGADLRKTSETWQGAANDRTFVAQPHGQDDGASVSSSRMTAAEEKQRLRLLDREVNRASALSSPRDTAGFFKKACSTDLLFLIDTTGSMASYIDSATEQVKGIVADIKTAFLEQAEVRVAVVGYKDHADMPNIQFLDFTSSTDRVRSFLDGLVATGGDDMPEDVLGGVQKALRASWKHEARCIVHIADAPPHSRALHDLKETSDNYINPGSEPHGLTHEPLLRKLAQLKINYALLRVNSSTDRMAFTFSRIYATTHADVKLHNTNTYYSQAKGLRAKVAGVSGSLWSGASTVIGTGVQFEELQLGTTYSALRHLVVRAATGSASRAATRLSASLKRSGKSSAFSEKDRKLGGFLTAIKEDGGTVMKSGASAGDAQVLLETAPPKWGTPGWLDQTLLVEGYCPEVVVHSASTLNDMMARDENIKLSVAQLTIYARSKPFAKGAIRTASYASTAASTDRFVIKSFMRDGMELAHMVEDMRCQALCKAFALEFNSLVGVKHSIDFIVTMCLQGKPGTPSADDCISLEPYIHGPYIKYNNNCGFVKEDEGDDHFNHAAQAFSHFTFERSWGSFLVSDLQGVGRSLTDPAIHTKDPDKFTLNDTNLNLEGFTFFFATHVCNAICRKLELKSTREMAMSGAWEFREWWPTMDQTVCCSNKLCRRILRLADASTSDKFPGFHWCDSCFPQLQSSTAQWICAAPGPNHEFDVSKFFYESQARVAPRKCPDHLEKDTTISGASVLGESLWARMKSTNQRKSISGRSW